MSTFVSYAQNFEDVMLWRALKHVENGFYVDVGAQHPSADSVSKAFYDRGWSGIDIEPVPAYAQLLRDERPRDTVLELAVANETGSGSLYVIAETGLSTMLKPQAEIHRETDLLDYTEIVTETKALRDILRPFEDRDIHWLKIDVEGAEEQVLRSWVGSPSKPWIFVVESTLPNQTEEVHQSWEPILIEAAYRFVYFDGLNRFYISREHPELGAAFRTPPNVFDRFELSSIDQARTGFARVEGYAKSLELAIDAHVGEFTRLADQSNAASTRLETEIQTLKSAHLVSTNYANSLLAQIAEKDREFAILQSAATAARDLDLQRDADTTARFEALQRSLQEASVYARSLLDQVDVKDRHIEALNAALAEQAAAARNQALGADTQIEQLRHQFLEVESYAKSLEAERHAMTAAMEARELEARELEARTLSKGS